MSIYRLEVESRVGRSAGFEWVTRILSIMGFSFSTWIETGILFLGCIVKFVSGLV